MKWRLLTSFALEVGGCTNLNLPPVDSGERDRCDGMSMYSDLKIVVFEDEDFTLYEYWPSKDKSGVLDISTDVYAAGTVYAAGSERNQP
jgi:hypothetical protein